MRQNAQSIQKKNSDPEEFDITSHFSLISLLPDFLDVKFLWSY